MGKRNRRRVVGTLGRCIGRLVYGGMWMRGRSFDVHLTGLDLAFWFSVVFLVGMKVNV